MQQSIWRECFKEFINALDLRKGSTRPVEKDDNSSSSSSDDDDKVEDHYSDIIHNEDSKATNFSKKIKADSAYSVYSLSGKKQ